MTSSISTYDYECTRKCHLPHHGNAITAALTKKSVSDELLAAYVAKTCRNFAEILDDQGRSALHLAASVGRYAIAEWLINNGASIALKDGESGHTALHRAMYYGCVGVAALLLKHGAVIDVPDEDFVNPLQLCSNIPKHKDNGIGHEIVVWGKNKNYNLGIGNVEGRDNPDFIDYFRKHRITIEKMSINSYHSVFLTKSGDVYSTGHGRGGRLGNGAENTVVFPAKVSVHTRSAEERIIDVSTGRHHTLLLSDHNCIYSCGENNHCQLGIKPPPEKQLTFKEIGGLHNFADKRISRIIAKDFHSMAICEADVYVWGQNGGQFGMKKEVNPVMSPRPLPLEIEQGKDKLAVANNIDTTIKLVESSNAAIVVYTKSSYLYIFNNFKRRTYKNPLMEKFECISVSGGEFVSKKEDAPKHSKQLRILAFTVSRNIYIWYEDCQQFVRCVFAQSRNLEIEKILWCNNNALVLLMGNLYYGTITHKLNAHAVTQISEYTETYAKKEMSTTTKTRIELKRIRNLNNVADFVCDDDGENFAALVENSRRCLNVPEMEESNYDFGKLLTEAHEMDGVHDLVLVVDYQSFPVHRFIVYNRCRHLRKLAERQANEKEIHLNGYECLTASIFELVLRYIYTNEVLSREDVESLVTRLNPGATVDKESTGEMVTRLRKIFKQLEIGALNESLKSLSDCPPIEDYPKLARESYPDLMDVTIRLQDNQEIKAHKCVLMARLEYFNMMFSHTWTESKTVNLTTIPLEYMEPIVDFLYNNDYQKIRDQKYSESFLFNMVVICDQFFIEELKTLFEVTIADRINLKNVAELLEYAFQYNCEMLKNLCMQFISVNLAKVLELRTLECLEAPILAQVDQFYKEFYQLADYRTITPSADAISDEDLVLFVEDFHVGMNVKVNESTTKSKTPKGKITPKSTKMQLEKRNYEKEAMGYIRDLSFEEIPIPKSEEKKMSNGVNVHVSVPEKEIKSWQKVVDKKDPKKKSIPVALKVNEAVKNESKGTENFSNLRSILEKASSPAKELSSPAATPERKEDEYDSGYSSSRITTFNLSDFALQKPKLSQKQRKRLSSTSEKPKELIPVASPEITPTNPWKNVNNSAADMFKSEPIAITSPRGNRKISTSNGSFEPASPLSNYHHTQSSPHVIASSPKPISISAATPPTATIVRPAKGQKEFSKILEDERKHSATVGLKNKEYAVLIALKRASSELSSYQKKIISIDDHLGISIAGITADARILSRYMRTECLNYKYSYDDNYPVGRLIANVGNKMQVCTQRYDRRPYGVGLLVAGYDDQGPHIYQTCPSANFFDCKAMSIGSRSQSARTYLEKHLNEFPDCSKEELIRHGVQALQDTLPNEVELNNKNISIAIVGKDEKFRILEEQENAQYLTNIVRRGGGGIGQAGGSGGQPPADDDQPQPPNEPTPAVAMES